MKKPSGNIVYHQKRASFESFIPAGWTAEKKRKTLGSFSSREFAQNAIQLYYKKYVDGQITILPLDSSFDPPGRMIGRHEIVKKMKAQNLYNCKDCSIEFNELKDPKQVRCENCAKLFKKKFNKTYNELNEEQKHKVKEAKKKYNKSEKGIIKNRERIQSKEYQQKIKEWCERYQKSDVGKKKRREYQRRWLEIPENRIAANIGGVLNQTLKGEHISQHTIKYTGLNSGEELMTYLETLFTEGMTRENYGIPKDSNPGWAVDHIIPRKLYDHSDEQEIFKCWNFHNLQPMWMKDNSTKGCKLTPKMFDVPVEYWPKCLMDYIRS